MVVVGVGGLVRDAGELNVLLILFPFCPSLFFLSFFPFFLVSRIFKLES